MWVITSLTDMIIYDDDKKNRYNMAQNVGRSQATGHVKNRHTCLVYYFDSSLYF